MFYRIRRENDSQEAIMTWFDNRKTPKFKQQDATARSSKVPEGLWVKCTSCGEILQTKTLKESFGVCTECQFHSRISAQERIEFLVDDGSFEEYSAHLHSTDPLGFDDTKPYRDRLAATAEKLGMSDALISGSALIEGIPLQLAVFEFRFLGGSMSAVVGEKIARVFDQALKTRTPAVVFSSSGGARMQEGILSLMQMAKTTASLEALKDAGIPYISVLTDPTTGGVAASFAMLGDVILAEPGALIGFAGPRVIEQTIRQPLPEGFQRSEFLMKHGFVDRIVPRKDLRSELAAILRRLGGYTCFLSKSESNPAASRRSAREGTVQ